MASFPFNIRRLLLVQNLIPDTSKVVFLSCLSLFGYRMIKEFCVERSLYHYGHWVTVYIFLQRNMSPVTRADHQTQSYKRTPDFISYSAKLVILDALLPASKPASRLSQASEHSSVPKLTNLLINH